MCEKNIVCGECPAKDWVKCSPETRKEHISQVYRIVQTLERIDERIKHDSVPNTLVRHCI